MLGCSPQTFWTGILALDGTTLLRRGDLLRIQRPDDDELLELMQIKLPTAIDTSHRNEWNCLGDREPPLHRFAVPPGGKSLGGAGDDPADASGDGVDGRANAKLDAPSDFIVPAPGSEVVVPRQNGAGPDARRPASSSCRTDRVSWQSSMKTASNRGGTAATAAGLPT